MEFYSEYLRQFIFWRHLQKSAGMRDPARQCKRLQSLPIKEVHINGRDARCPNAKSRPLVELFIKKNFNGIDQFAAAMG